MVHRLLRYLYPFLSLSVSSYRLSSISSRPQEQGNTLRGGNPVDSGQQEKKEENQRRSLSGFTVFSSSGSHSSRSLIGSQPRRDTTARREKKERAKEANNNNNNLKIERERRVSSVVGGAHTTLEMTKPDVRNR
ncbi:hypothetical protein OUZ56_022708 [Daphnia magna]|uniref:Uncharacterized protein n=1 Tax=Daphnia magna TaxID=35525 RepID=A0ABR0AX79_9CRUS|nr:hypothetical protein OUZ56_022708 [Daphnia magna]